MTTGAASRGLCLTFSLHSLWTVLVSNAMATLAAHTHALHVFGTKDRNTMLSHVPRRILSVCWPSRHDITRLFLSFLLKMPAFLADHQFQTQSFPGVLASSCSKLVSLSFLYHAFIVGARPLSLATTHCLDSSMGSRACCIQSQPKQRSDQAHRLLGRMGESYLSPIPQQLEISILRLDH